MTANPPQQASDFEYIYNPDGTCHFWYCGKPGKLLVYDDFSPEGGLWFCEECWKDFQGDDADWLTIVEDRRPLVLFFQAIADVAAMKIVEDIFHYESEDNESYDEVIERLEDFLAEETPYS